MLHETDHWVMPLPRDQVLPTLLSDQVQLALAHLREDVLEARLERLPAAEGEQRFVIHLRSYGRTPTGKIDRGQTVRSSTHNHWRGDTLAWRWEGHRRVLVSGHLRVEREGAQTRFTSRREVEVPVPVVGRAIERLVLRELSRDEPKWREMLADQLGLR
ncbi:MAG: DUF2505 family protein [Deltaproteobacteria bacterium]|nr:DUF2505 family protein [Deltaproteobacteria bacterium]